MADRMYEIYYSYKYFIRQYEEARFDGFVSSSVHTFLCMNSEYSTQSNAGKQGIYCRNLLVVYYDLN
jgi:hypothetical protein